jgi:hypothetical protein
MIIHDSSSVSSSYPQFDSASFDELIIVISTTQLSFEVSGVVAVIKRLPS